jgi:D-tagatose 6-phosphate 4-epimerase
MTVSAPHPLLTLRQSRDAGRPVGLVSVCSAHPLALEAALQEARDSGSVALVEATCNQVNRDGGYTGMQPGSRRRYKRVTYRRATIAK